MTLKRRQFLSGLCGLLLLCVLRPSLNAAEPKARQWTVDGTLRDALIAVPENARAQKVPVVFAFHGHGGSMRNAARSFRMHQHWPEAICVYMQGLNTPGQLTDPEGRKPGWQKSKGDQQDRDLKFFDAVLESLNQEYRIDMDRIYSTGHSNGGGFTYLLWAERGELLAAVAPSGSAAARRQKDLKPKPAMHIAGENDPLVKYAWQVSTIEGIRRLNRCGAGVEWEGVCTMYPSEIGAPVVTLITSQGHRFPQEAPPLIVRFFKQHSKASR